LFPFLLATDVVIIYFDSSFIAFSLFKGANCIRTDDIVEEEK